MKHITPGNIVLSQNSFKLLTLSYAWSECEIMHPQNSKGKWKLLTGPHMLLSPVVTDAERKYFQSKYLMINNYALIETMKQT